MDKMTDSKDDVKPTRTVVAWSTDPSKPKIPKFNINSNIGNNLPVNLPSAYLRFQYSQHTQFLGKHKNEPPRDHSKRQRNIIKKVEKYCKNSTLHGLKYVGDSELSLRARVFWFISFSVAVGFSTYFISNIYLKWNTSPVIISYNPFYTDLNSIPFPAVTICNMNRVKKNEAEKIVKEGSYLENKLLDDSCDGNATFNNVEKFTWESLRNYLMRVGNSCSDMLKWCHWGGNEVNCSDYFIDELTDEGLCCSFNRLPPKYMYRNWKDINILNQTRLLNVYDWNPETGYEGFTHLDDIPRRPKGAGPNMGLSITVDAQVDNYYCSSTRSTGFKVLLSSPRETPKVADFGFLVGPGFENRIEIEPSRREATFSLRSVDVEKRQCFFTHERKLQYYSQYTQKNCLLECQSIYTFKLCRCVPYYLPKNKTIRYCSKKEKDCVGQAKIYMETVVGDSDSCHCLPACFYVKYDYSKSMSYLFQTVHSELPNMTKEYLRDNAAIMHFYFSSTKFASELKSELFGFTEILSNVGGLLSLFLGFSLLSLIEIFYHILLRDICNSAKQKIERSRKKKDAVMSRISSGEGSFDAPPSYR